MHYARIDNSPRLQRVATYLRKTKKATTYDIIANAKVCAVSAVISELRANGWEIDCSRTGDVWTYTVKADA